MRYLIAITIVVIALLHVMPVFAQTFNVDRDTSVIGQTGKHTVQKGDSLIELARSSRVGYNSITLANPGVDPFVPGENREVVLPTQWVLPQASSGAIVINLSEMRLYYFHPDGAMVSTFPIGIGDEGLDTPVGTFKIIAKIANPAWHPPASIRKERPELPAVVPPGPDNPLGSHALRLSAGKGSYLLHGTNRPYAIGRRATHGCIRLYPEEIPILFDLVDKGTRVEIVRQPVKAGMLDGRVFVEIHEDPDSKVGNYFDAANELLKRKGLIKNVESEKLLKAVRKKDGVPTDISRGTKKEGPKPPAAPEFWTL
ncbi:MAG TPA: L,D-transpeptidase family protein [Dissulfurispiraceae bacterium]|nr:L,D-transpeptidase family protein [Dissulfurispiraceae bacterium]